MSGEMEGFRCALTGGCWHDETGGGGLTKSRSPYLCVVCLGAVFGLLWLVPS